MDSIAPATIVSGKMSADDSKLPYREDIDGLRAIAVLLVVAFHAFPALLPGGFVGVDVFFVISGFLITDLIAKEIDGHRFSLLRFYGRRARRIFPALFLVLTVCLIVGWILLLPTDYRNLGADSAWSAAFAANIALYLQTGYFDAAAEMKPLLHLWSLGIEEQFYLVWPLLLMLAARRRWMWQAASCVLIASLACNLWLTAVNPNAAFYLPFSRVWELAVGALLALMRARQSPSGAKTTRPLEHLYATHHARIHTAAAWIGLALLLATAFLIDRDQPFPGWRALLPTIATALLIFAGPHTVINQKLLSQGALVAIGLISYPLYLWHWPLLVFARIARFGSEPTILMKLALVALAFVLAAVTYRWLERPFRFGRPAAWKPVGATLGLAAAACFGIAVWASAGMPGRFPEGLQHLLRDFEPETRLAYRSGSCFLEDTQDSTSFAEDCLDQDPAAAPLVLLWGDSYAAHVFPGLAEHRRRTMSMRLAEYTASGCPPILGFSNAQRPNCAEVNDDIAGRIATLKPETVILAGRWSLYDGREGWGSLDADQIRQTIAALKASGVQRIVVVGQFPIWSLPPQMILTRDYQIDMMAFRASPSRPLPRDSIRYLDVVALAAEPQVRQLWSDPDVLFVSPKDTLCSNARCLLLTPGSDAPIAWDQGHLTTAGSIYFVQANAGQLLGSSPNR